MAENFDEYAYLEEAFEGNPDVSGDAKPEVKESKSKEKDRDRDRDRKEKKSRHRSRSKERSGKDSERRDRDKDRKRDRDDRDRKKEKERRRSRSRSPRKPRETSADREMERTRRRQEREAEERQRELEELDRDTRTVFAYNLSTKAGERDMFEFFSQAGSVLDVRIIYDRNTPKSKGMAYIEMASQTEIPGALALTGQMLKGQVVMVKASEAEKNLAWEAAQQAKTTPAGAMPTAFAGLTGSLGPCKLQVLNLHPNVMEEDLMDIFKPFGEIDMLLLNKDEQGNSRGVAVVQYKSTASAMQAIQQLDKLDLAGQTMQVSVAPVLMMPEMMAPQLAMPAQDTLQTNLDDDQDQGMRMDARARATLMARLAGQEASAAAMGAAGMFGMAGVTSAMPSVIPGAMPMPGALGAAGVPGLQLPTALPTPLPGMMPGAVLPGPPGMSAAPASATVLPGSAAPPVANGAALEQGFLGSPSPIPTRCLLLKNLFDAAAETEPEWWIDIAEDVKEECGRHGPVDHIFVDKDSKGFVYLRFATVQGCMAAQQALNNRWFARRMIVADFQFQAVYDAHFGLTM
mmetsp:Transcript_19465/g.37288  ORF Transcript_19465/g.37288 Transcript_19465/m.37288 type:complete len:572 (-) Transcript_19465:848-2563(-)